MTRRNDALAWLALGVVYLVWGSTYLGIRVAVATIPPFLMTGTRWLIAGALLFTWQWCTSKERPALPARRELAELAITATLLLVLGNGLLCIAEIHVESATAALLITSTPIWMLLIDAVRARRVPRMPAVAGVMLGTIGIVMLAGKHSGHVDALFAWLIVVASLAWAAGSIYARGKDHRPTTASLEMVIGGLSCIAVGLLTGEASRLDLHAVAAASLWGMAWLITGGAMVGYSAFAYAVRRLPTATVATYAYVNPIVAVILGAAVLHERITLSVVAGGAALVASVILILWRSG